MKYDELIWEVIGVDYNSPFFRNNLWTHSFFVQAELFGAPRAVLGIICRNNNIEYITDRASWKTFHETLRARVESNPQTLYDLLSQTEEHCRTMNHWTEKNIFTVDLTNLSNDELTKLLTECIPQQEKAYALGTALVLLDFDSFSFIEGNLKDYLQKNVGQENYAEYFSTFTAPPHFSFAQEQELELLKVMEQYNSVSGWKEGVLNGTVSEIKSNYPDFYSDLEKHTQKYCWVYYVYMGPAFNLDQFLDFIRDYLRKHINPSEKIAEIYTNAAKIKQKKIEYLGVLKPTEFDRAILELAGLIVWSKPRRKDYQSKSYYHIEKLLREIARRLTLTLDQARSAPYDILINGLSGYEIDVHTMNDIKSFHVCIPSDDGKVITLVGNEAQKFSESIQRKNNSQNYENIRELQGTIACPGIVTGTVKIVNTPTDMTKMEYGDILISTATTPSIVAAMKKASAIVTDEGGLTCHASIVSRELNIPCVVGTKCATKVFKDGDTVEVNTEKGIIKKVS